jgi:hypothetical protein
MLYRVHLAWAGFELTSVVIGTDYIGSCKSNYHTITRTTPNSSCPELVTGLLFNKKNEIYRKTGWTFLSTRRNRRNLLLFYNIVNTIASGYICRLIPPPIQGTTVYAWRNGSDVIIPYCQGRLDSIIGPGQSNCTGVYGSTWISYCPWKLFIWS